ncbi:tyrosine-type recombinase/integrase [Pectobacterium polaris]|uniref:tyrosine-type recombinase/integrase n=1 Tax=Pectobacterium polaris TaxID=2042057 RepID=UPI0023B18706|nr:integrase arm-type DNA-binding domain-containing protein [Pectobacterium polaris]MDE8755118.1 tyrosine-type recombinase/integrase [Pectobacterium polaris]
MPLNDSKIRNLKPSAKPFKVSDSHGLYLLVNLGGSRLWYLKYRINKKESRLSLGAYPDVSLADARQQRDGIRKLLAQNINPTQQRAAEKAARSPAKSFKTVALSWHKSNRTWSENHAARLLASMNNHIFPIIGHLPITELKTRHFIELLKGVEKKGLLEVAARTRQHMCNIMRHAVHQELIEHNPAANLDGIIAPPVKRHYPALPLEQLPELLTRIENYKQGRELTRLAVSLTLHLFIRSSELRFARWSEIDFKSALWVIPEQREAIEGIKHSGRGAKMRRKHYVPLCDQALAILEELKDLTYDVNGDDGFILTGCYDAMKPMSENTINKALRKMGYDTKTDLCGHGFRTLACSALIESGIWPEDVVELQMSHMEKNNVRAAYTHKAKHLEQRRLMLQWWADFLDANSNGMVRPFEFGQKG